MKDDCQNMGLTVLCIFSQMCCYVLIQKRRVPRFECKITVRPTYQQGCVELQHTKQVNQSSQ